MCYCLSLVSNKIIQSHGGSIGVESILNEGSTFFFKVAAKYSRVSGADINVEDTGTDTDMTPSSPSLSISKPHTSSAPDSVPAGLELLRIEGAHRSHDGDATWPLRKALVVDDSIMNRKMMINMIRRYFMSIDQVSTAVS